MLDPVPERVAFEFADHQLVGSVVDATTTARYNHGLETVLTVEVDDSRYAVSERQATPM